MFKLLPNIASPPTRRGYEIQLEWSHLQSVYHQVIEALRREIDLGGGRSAADIRAELCEVVEEGIAFYEGFLERMQSIHEFRLDMPSGSVVGDGVGGSGLRSGKPGPSSGILKVNTPVGFMSH